VTPGHKIYAPVPSREPVELFAAAKRVLAHLSS
jgi:hypothetical protein